ncbi:MAG TPA: tripartite tricarboxylate transporter substrate binding protein, partial [Burkholderiaceae bacterium]|nr:tripartite tricarboxylate transporter substrate binding protein [Burkholderiaceae bacterium]
MNKFLIAVAFALATVTGAQAQSWPAKPVTLVVPFPAGGSTDSVARAIAPKLSAAYG